ncbi:MAG: hypothetical protein M0R47_06915 [Methylobacter sp.]|uniref:hypothetical protein n=1 Tax=Methylobacter sp. TaxID=2051955 RepID=UPI0025ED3E30|nr:hypothetical protein [Methylobacter sp.]MCK9620253.1 hypothetical protein [Methylobacter sp.]
MIKTHHASRQIPLADFAFVFDGKLGNKLVGLFFFEGDEIQQWVVGFDVSADVGVEGFGVGHNFLTVVLIALAVKCRGHQCGCLLACFLTH